MSLFTKLLIISRKVYLHTFSSTESWKKEERGIYNPTSISELISQFIMQDKPCMITRFGSNELDSICNYLAVNHLDNKRHNLKNYTLGNCAEWWWNPIYLKRMLEQAGFFPSTPETITKFSKLMLNDCQQIDVLGAWRKREAWLEHFFPSNMIRVDRENINPFFAEKPWTLALKGKKVLVIHPFTDSIIKQYAQKDKLFPRQILPAFDLKVIRAVQSIGGNSQFENWFEALNYMKEEMDKIDYDIVLIGCGAYGFPLAAHAKRMGKKAIHIGGALQLYFGIKGKRWESENYKGSANDYSSLYNDYWVRPSKAETPTNANKVEDSCYW